MKLMSAPAITSSSGRVSSGIDNINTRPFFDRMNHTSVTPHPSSSFFRSVSLTEQSSLFHRRPGWVAQIVVALVLISSLLASRAAGVSIPSDLTVDVISFGATANDATDDTAAINRAINYVGDQGGGTVIIPPGVFIINSQEFHTPLRTRSHLRLLGRRDASGGRILSVLKMLRPHSNRSLLMIGDPRYADETGNGVVDETATQSDIEITDLAFDLDNGHGGRAIQLRYLTREVYIHDCEGFQSALDRGEPLDSTPGGDNHFFNMGCYGQPRLRRVPENIVIERCNVRGTLQLTADGGAGSINLIIRDNSVTGAFSHSIAITSLSREVYFENIKILNNQILDIGGNGIYISQDQNDSHHYVFQEGERSVFKNLLIFGNTLQLGPTSAANSGGIHVGSFIEMSDVAISNNTISGYPSGNSSRFALTISPWDYNWNRDHPNSIVTAAASFIGPSQIKLPAHGLITGMQIEFQPFNATGLLPSGLEAFRRYRVNYIDADTISLTCVVGGTPVAFGPDLGTGSFSVIFSPATEQLRISHNTVDGPWDYSLVMSGSIEADVVDNLVENVVCIAGEHEALVLAGNTFTHMLVCKIPAWDAGCSFLCAATGGSPTRPAITSIMNNTWNLQEDLIGPVYVYTAAVTLDPRDPRRTMEYIFDQNTISFAPTRAPKYRQGFRDAEQTGTILAYYGENLVDRGMYCSPSNLGPTLGDGENPPAFTSETVASAHP